MALDEKHEKHESGIQAVTDPATRRRYARAQI